MSARISFEEAIEKWGRTEEPEEAGEVIDELHQRAEALEANCERLREVLQHVVLRLEAMEGAGKLSAPNSVALKQARATLVATQLHN